MPPARCWPTPAPPRSAPAAPTPPGRPTGMKKGRPAHTVSVLADPVLAPDLAARLCAETGSLGVRGRMIERWPRAREDGVVEVDGVPVRIKVGAGRIKVEHDDA